MKAFDSFWNDLLIDLRTPKKITNWTVKNGNVGEDFTAQEKNNHTILCTTPKGSEQSIPRKDFELIYESWEGYLSGELCERISEPDTRFSKYNQQFTNSNECKLVSHCLNVSNNTGSSL